jgi:hypothetical protein
MAKAMARAMASGAIASLSRDSVSWALTCAFGTMSVKSVQTKPGR